MIGHTFVTQLHDTFRLNSACLTERGMGQRKQGDSRYLEVIVSSESVWLNDATTWLQGFVWVIVDKSYTHLIQSPWSTLQQETTTKMF